MRLSRWVIALSVLVMSTCASAQYTEPGTDARRIAIAVWVGHELKLQQMGTLVFGNQFGAVRASDDQLATLVYTAIERELALERRFELRRLAVPPSELAKLASKAAERSTNVWMPSIGHMLAELGPLRAQCNCDAILVAAEGNAEIELTNQRVRGLTMFRRPQTPPDSVMAVSSLALFLVDSQSGNVVARSTTGPSVAFVRMQWPGNASDVRELDPAAWTAMYDGLYASVAGALMPSLYEVGLRPSCTYLFYLRRTPPQKRDPQNADYLAPPPTPEGANSDWCTAPMLIR